MHLDPSMVMRVGGVDYIDDGTSMNAYPMAVGQPSMPPSQQQPMQQQMSAQPGAYFTTSGPPPPMGIPPGQQMQYFPQMQVAGGMMQAPNIAFRSNPRGVPGPMLVSSQGMGPQLAMQMQPQGPVVAGVMGTLPQRVPGQPQMMQQQSNIVQIGFPRPAPMQVFSQNGGVPMQLTAQPRPIIYRTGPDGQQFIQQPQGGGYYQVVGQAGPGVQIGGQGPMFQQISPALGEMGGINLVPALVPGQMGARQMTMQGMYQGQPFQAAPVMQGGVMPAQLYTMNRAPTMDGTVIQQQQLPPQQPPSEPQKPKRSIVVKDKDGNIMDMSVKAQRSAPAAPAPQSTPQLAVVPPAEPLSSSSHTIKITYAPSPTSTTEDEVAPIDYPTPFSSSASATEESSKPQEASAPAAVEPPLSQTQEDLVINPPPIEEPATPEPSAQEAVVAPSEPSSNAAAPEEKVEEEDEDDWEKVNDHDIKQRLSLASSHASPHEEAAHASAPVSSSSSASESKTTEFIFPTSKASGEDGKKSQKQSKKEKYAAADSAVSSGSASLLDAFVITPPLEAKPNKPTPTASHPPQKAVPTKSGAQSKASPPANLPPTNVVEPPKPTSSTQSQSPRNAPPKPAPSSSFKDSEESIVIRPPSPEASVVTAPAVSSVRRSLRPGGGSQVTILNMGLKGIEKPRLVYSQQDLKQIISQLIVERPPALKCYEFISLVDGAHSSTVRAVCMGGKPQGSSGASPGGPRGGAGGGGNGGGVAEGSRWTKYPTPQHEDRYHGPYSGSPHHHAPQQHQQQHRQSRKKTPVGPMPKKVINDPIEKYDREVQQLLNKISPANYRKLCVQICSIPLESPVMISRLMSLIFEKAISEPSFARLYAELSSYIDDQMEHMFNNFFYVVKLAADQYRWVQGLEMPLEFAGPFSSETECLGAATSSTPPVLQPIKQGPLAHVSLSLASGLCVQVLKLLDRDAFYVTWIPASSINPASLSDKILFTADAAVKDYTKRHGFKKLLVVACQQQFFRTLSDGYEVPNNKRIELEALGNTISDNERAAKIFEIDELEAKFKRRLLGLIKFIGELFKVDFIKEHHIAGTIQTLMEENGEQWREMDERLIEILCKLLTTVGADLRHEEELSVYFSRLEDLANDKSQTSRSRFMCREVIDLRRNEWMRRKASENAADTAGYKTASKSEAKPVRIIRNVSAPDASSSRAGKSSAPPSPIIENRSGPIAPITIAPALGGRSGPASLARPPSGSSAAMREPRPAQSTPTSQKEPSLRSSSPAGPQSSSAASPAVSRAETPTPGAFQTAAKVIRDPKNIIEEYLSLEPNHPDAELCLDDLRACPVGKLLGALLHGCLEAKHGLPAWISLAEVLVDYIATAPEEVVSAIRDCEPLQLLGDTIMDYHQAPEHLGAIFAVLLRGDAIPSSVFLAVIGDMVKACLEDEFCLQDKVQSSFARLRASAAAN